MTRFIKKLLLFFSPILLLVLIYLISDPFKVIYNYTDYNEDLYIYKNRDFISTEMYLKNSKKFLYDSFIFGSSSTLGFPPSLWGNFIKTSNNIFSFDASGENIVGIWSKIKYIHESNHQIKNALIIFDTGKTFEKFVNKGHLFIKHYKVYHSSWLRFQLEFLTTFINIKLLTAIMHYKMSNHVYPYMANIIDDRFYHADLVTNELLFEGPFNELKTDSLNYYDKRKSLFKNRSNKFVENNPQINTDHIRMLKEIKDIFENDSTDFRIIITPLYNQISFNKMDLNILKTIFGEKIVFDYSGINEYTEKISNFYDGAHFKQYVGADLLKIIYESD
jgi:hypothetical protein